MRWDRHTFTALGGIAALLIASALLLEDAHALFTPVIGMVGGIAAPAMASLERLKQRKEVAVPYGMLDLPETDIYGPEYRALPPAEHMVLVAWYWDDGQKQIASLDDGFIFVRLGCQRGVLHVHPNLARVRHVVLRTDDAVVAPGLLLLCEPGFRVYTCSQLRLELGERAGALGVAAWEAGACQDDEERIYALFRTKPDVAYRGLSWNGSLLMDLIEIFESDRRHKLVFNLGRTSPCPRIISLRDLFKARFKLITNISSRAGASSRTLWALSAGDCVP